MHIVAGTAGHIDHGKTALVKALTGVNTDRLPEEKQRGITIDIGFAELRDGNVQVEFVDVPGHERFVRNMLAGASGIDLVLLVVAADEGVMPQTREHFDICRLLRIKQGIVVLTKSDLVDAETLELARLETADLVSGTFMNDAPVVAVSSRTGDGIEELKRLLFSSAASAAERDDHRGMRLPIDRSFAMKGFGSVVTGTLASGMVRQGDELELLPSGRRLRVRGVQMHGRPVDEAGAGHRTAINLGGIDHSEIHRGMMLAEPGLLHPGQVFDTQVEMLATAARPLRSRQRVRVDLGTAEVLARVAIVDESQEVAPGESGFVQLRLESPVAAVAGERFILRSYSPQVTIGGGSIIRPSAEKLRRRSAARSEELLRQFSAALDDETALAAQIIIAAGEHGVTLSEIRSVTGWTLDAARVAVDTALRNGPLIDAGGLYVAADIFAKLKDRAAAEIERHHKREPLSRGMPREELREKVFRRVRPETQKAVIAGLESSGIAAVERDVIRLGSHSARLSPAEQDIFDRLRAAYSNAGLEVPKLVDALGEIASATRASVPAVRKIFQLFLDSGEIVAATDEFYFTSASIKQLTEKLRAYADTAPGRLIDVAAFKDLAGVTRKYAIPLLEYLDGKRVTARSGDKRVIL